MCGKTIYKLVTFALLAWSSPAISDEAPWGCQIVLCAPQENPSWQGVPSCVPPMKRLIAAMKLPGFSWPICPGSGVGEPGKEKYMPCETGWSSVPEISGKDVCEKTVSAEEARQMTSHKEQIVGEGRYLLNDSKTLVVTRTANGRYPGYDYHLQVNKQRRADPWYFDFKNADGSVTRKWFNLNP